MTFLLDIHKNAGLVPGQTAASKETEKINYRQLSFQTNYVSNNAYRYGLGKGDSLLFMAQLTPKTLPLITGLLQAGVNIVIADPFTAPELFVNRVKSANITHMLVDYKLVLASKILPLLPKSPLKFNFLKEVKEVTLLTYGNVFDKQDTRNWLKDDMSPLEPWVSPEPDDVALTVFTSGTTSEPKGVQHTFKSLTANSAAVVESLLINPGSVVFSEPTSIGLACLMKGAHWIMPAKGEPVPEETEIWFSTPHDLLQEINNSQYTHLPYLHTVGLASAPVTVPTVDLILEKQGEVTNVVCFYGMTEFLPIAIGDAKLKKKHIQEGKTGDYVGELVGDTSAYVEEDSELFISGSGLMPGYLGKEPSDELATGDFARLEGKSVYLLGRKKDMYIRRSMNIYPGLYEPLLSMIEGVKDSALVGRRNNDSGDDYIILALILEPGEDEHVFRETLNKILPLKMDAESLPDSIVFMDSFPMSGRANKLDRHKLAEMVWEKVQR